MDRVHYQKLRFDVEQAIHNGIADPALCSDAITNNVMRLLLQALSADHVKAQRSNREFKTFRRNPETKVPGWAYTPTGKR